MEQPILNGLNAYNTEGCYPWHMPGHKRRLNTIFPDMVENPFLIDVTEEVGIINHVDGQVLSLEAFGHREIILVFPRHDLRDDGLIFGLRHFIAVHDRGDVALARRRGATDIVKELEDALDLRVGRVFVEDEGRTAVKGGMVSSISRRHRKEGKIVHVDATARRGEVQDVGPDDSHRDFGTDGGIPFIVGYAGAVKKEAVLLHFLNPGKGADRF